MSEKSDDEKSVDQIWREESVHMYNKTSNIHADLPMAASSSLQGHNPPVEPHQPMRTVWEMVVLAYKRFNKRNPKMKEGRLTRKK
ncbi:hypothetical protein NW762_008414 [Fusarium torreyae]|uniref:Uncharacterized protein n=1 Tax=Fusarium torreyae TaxID=1237075 RepID=A0A9W8RXL8_9HYPO|nr:hypothetical protein NW762_008414 [Fusarium torreyae]